jgi:glycosyltransferase involved in cell wall biosynthesis
VENTLERMATHQARAGAEVTVLTSAHGGRRTVEETVAGVRLIRAAEWARALSAPFCPSMPAHLARLKADVFHLHYPSPTGELSWLLVRPPGAMVITWHNDIIRQAAFVPIYRPFIHALLRGADAVMPTSEPQIGSSEFLRQYREKCTVVPHGVDLEPFEHMEEHAAFAAALRARHGAPVTLFVGRLVYYKGLDVMLAAMRDVPGTLVVVGEGPARAALETQCRALGLSGRVLFAGRVPDIVPYLAAADVGVLPSSHRTENFGLSMVEMMAGGRPVVCTELGTGTSFVNQNGETGIVVPPGDAAALSGAVRRLLEDDALRCRMGEAARARARRLFSTGPMMDGVSRVYEAVLAKRRTPR